MDRMVERCLADVMADHDRQGGVDEDDVYRLALAHRLDSIQVAEVREALQQRGVLDAPSSPSDDELDQQASTSDDAVGALLRQAGKIRLLTAEEEVHLGRRIALGLQAQEEGEDNRETRRLVRDGDRAREQLLLANLRLAFSVARQYQNRGLDLEDLLHEAILGLIRATEKFDYTKGFKFSTYATWWLRQSVTRGLADKGRLIRLPVHVVEKLNRVLKYQRELASELGRAPSLPELAKLLDMDSGAVQAILDYQRLQPASLNVLVGEVNSTELEHLIPHQAPSVEKIVEERDRTEDVHRRLSAMEHLSGGRAAEILRRRHGIGTDEPQTLDQIGAHFGVTRERVRQIESKAYKEARLTYFNDFHVGQTA